MDHITRIVPYPKPSYPALLFAHYVYGGVVCLIDYGNTWSEYDVLGV